MPSTNYYPSFDAYYLPHPELEKRHTINLWQYWDLLVRRKWVVIGFFLATMFLVALVTFLKTPIYLATTLVQITAENSGGLVGSKDSVGSLVGWEERKEFSQTQYEILKSRSLAQRVIGLLGLTNHKEYRIKAKEGKSIPPEMAEKIMINRFLGNLEIRPEKDSFLVRVSFESSDPVLAQQVSNTLVKEYVQFGMESRSHAYQAVQQWLDHQIKHLRAKIETSEKQLYGVGEELDVTDPEAQGNVIIQKYSDLSGLLTKSESDRMAKEAQFNQIRERGPDAPAILNNALILHLRQEVAGQEAKVASLSKVYLPGHPEMQAEASKLGGLRSRLNSEVNRLTKSVKAEYEAAKRTEDMLRESLKNQKDRVATFQRAAVKYKIIKRDVQTNEELYKGLLSRMKEASVAATLVPTNVQVIDPAELPLVPSRPNKKLNLLLATIFGLFGGVGLAFLVDYLDGSIKSTEEWERVCQLPVLGSVPSLFSDTHLPAVTKDQNPKMIYVQQPQSGISEAIRHLRTTILLSPDGPPPKVILVTSPSPGEGKTTVSVNLSCSLALQGRKVVLIDADMRNPQLHRTFVQPDQPGLSDFLKNNGVPLEEILRSTEVPKFSIIPAGAITATPAELLGAETCRELIGRLSQNFDHVIVDSPPILGFADALILSSMVDGVLLVVKHLCTPFHAGRLACEALQKIKAPLIGTVINDVVYNKYSKYGNYHYYYNKTYNDYYKNTS